MGLFKNTHLLGNNVKAYELDGDECGADCTKCSNGKCTKQWHSQMTEHISSGSKGCGHRWRD